MGILCNMTKLLMSDTDAVDGGLDRPVHMGESRKKLIGFGISWGLIHTIPCVTARIRPQQYWLETVIRLCSWARADSRRDSAELIAFTHRPPCEQGTCNENTEVKCVSDKVSVFECRKVRGKSLWERAGLECVCVYLHFSNGVCMSAFVQICSCVCLHARSLSNAIPPGAPRSPIP